MSCEANRSQQFTSELQALSDRLTSLRSQLDEELGERSDAVYCDLTRALNFVNESIAQLQKLDRPQNQ